MNRKDDEKKNKVEMLEQKLAETTEQSMPDYLDGLLYSKPVNYWDYIQLNTLLNLQKPKTDFKDETIFIAYHQICELMFLLIIQECHALCFNDSPVLSAWEKHLTRIIRYFKYLISSFDIMTGGLDRTEFIAFRKALFPSSGFQSVQYRKIEIYSSALYQLVHAKNRSAATSSAPLYEQYEDLYWKFGNRDLKTSKKTLTLKQFESEYDDELLRLSQQLETKNIRAKYLALPQDMQENTELVMLNIAHLAITLMRCYLYVL